MAKVFILDKAQYLAGLVNLYRGDQWNLTGKVVERIGRVDQDVDLTSAAVTGFFPGDPVLSPNGPVGVVATVTNAKAGELAIPVPPSASSGVQLSPDGTSVYLHIQGLSQSPMTVSTPEADIVISDPGFLST